jgi:hypothetical protein
MRRSLKVLSPALATTLATNVRHFIFRPGVLMCTSCPITKELGAERGESKRQ